MSFVYFLDVFDPDGLPDGMPDQAAADHQRGRRLSQPSSKLVQLLATIRGNVTSATVNVVGGQEALPVEWQPGPPPTASGAGASCALWSLILPVEDEIDPIEEVVPQLIMWAKEFGLRIYDAQQDLLASKSYTVLKSAKEVKSDLAADSHLSKGGVEVFLMDAHGWVHIGARSIPRYLKDHPDGSVAQACKEFLRGQELDGHFGAYLRRLLVRLEQRFPFQLFGQSVWCGRHPMHDPVYSGDGVRLIQVASGMLDDVLRHLLPLARELFLAVAVPSQNFYVHREFREEQFETNDSERLRSLDQCWSQHRLSTEQVDRQFQLALGDFLKPLGFVPTEDKRPAKFAYWRKAVDGVMHLISYRPGDGLRAEVISERFWHIRASQMKSLAFQNSPIVMMDFERLRGSSSFRVELDSENPS